MFARMSAIALLTFATTCCWGQEAPLTLTEGGESRFSIVHAPDAPPTVVQAAEELQHYLLRATGAELPIVTEADGPAIRIGTAAGIDLTGAQWESYRIVTEGGNLLIAGRDTAEGEHTATGGTSAGTRNGVYAFLEEFLGVRWLMPGEHGDHVPTVETLVIPQTDLQDAPFFANRRLPYTQYERAPVQTWLDRQRMARRHGPEGHSLQLYHGHNWRVIPVEAFETNPEWFPEHGGQRMPPTAHYKLCISNPGVVEQFAEAARRRFDAGHYVFSLSPSDGGGWCECANCREGYFIPEGHRRQVTTTVLNFYNAVAEAVAPDYPDRIFAGYVYQHYVFPPPEQVELHPSVFLVWAPDLAYGFTLFRPETRDLWEQLAVQWTEITDSIAYYDLPNYVGNSIGAPNPPALEILKFLYPRLQQYGFRGVYVYGNPAWGHSALMNYLLAKLAWDPGADIDAIAEDFLSHCYHEGAEDVAAIYSLLDEATKQFYLDNPSEGYRFSEARMKQVYADNLAQIERLYRAAEGKITDESASERLARLGVNLTLLHGNLRRFGMIEDPQASSFHLDDPAFNAFVDEHRDSLYIRPIPEQEVPEAVRISYSVEVADELPQAEEVQPFRLRGRQHLILREKGDEPMTVTMRRITARGALPSYTIYDTVGDEISSGVFQPNVPVIVETLGADYCHLLISTGGAFYALEVEGARWALSDSQSDRGAHFLGDLTPVYFHVPEGTGEFSLWLAAEAPGETAAATLVAPDGREVSTFDVTQMSVDEQSFEIGPEDAGWWKLVPTEPATGIVDDVWIRLGAQIPGWLCPEPENALIVAPVR